MAARSDNSIHLKKAFLAAYAQTGNISAAARAAEVGRQDHYRWLEADPEYADAFKQASEDAVEGLELEARRRAERGVQRLKFHNGQPIMVRSDPDDPESTLVPYVEHEYSDTLMIFLLKGLKPAKYRERHEITGPEGGPVKVMQVEL